MTTRLENLKSDALAKGLLASEVVQFVSAEMLGEAACRVVYQGQDGALGRVWKTRAVRAKIHV